MDLLKKFIKIDNSDKSKNPSNWFILLCVGLVLFFLSSTIFDTKDNKAKNSNLIPEKTVQQSQASYEANMEKRLKTILSNVEGAGNVEVMLTISYGKEIVLANDTVTQQNESDEKDNAGGTRNNKNYSQEKKTVMYTPSNGNSEPVVLKEIEPKIEGIIIVAEGGDNIVVQQNLIKASQALFNIPAHKIEVFKMK